MGTVRGGEPRDRTCHPVTRHPLHHCPRSNGKNGGEMGSVTLIWLSPAEVGDRAGAGREKITGHVAGGQRCNLPPGARRADNNSPKCRAHPGRVPCSRACRPHPRRGSREHAGTRPAQPSSPPPTSHPFPHLQHDRQPHSTARSATVESLRVEQASELRCDSTVRARSQ